MVRRPANNPTKGSLGLLLLYLFLSIFSALIFSILYRRSINKGNKGKAWVVLTIICALFYGTLALSLIRTSSPTVDANYYWLGVITLITNFLAIILVVTKKGTNNYGTSKRNI